jgi:hypothetical protein
MNAESAYGHASIHASRFFIVITPWNDFVDLKIMIKNTKTETGTFYLRTRRRTCESSFNERNIAHIGIDFVYGDPAMSLKHTLKKINSTGDVLLKESINAIVRYDGEN